MGHQYRSQIPRKVEDYFLRQGIPAAELQHPVIHQIFIPGKGWKRLGMKKRVTASYARSLKRDLGVTHIAVRAHGRVADFSVQELTWRPITEAERKRIIGRAFG